MSESDDWDEAPDWAVPLAPPANIEPPVLHLPISGNESGIAREAEDPVCAALVEVYPSEFPELEPGWDPAGTHARNEMLREEEARRRSQVLNDLLDALIAERLVRGNARNE